jgi:uncharacterized protein (DUF934 family)
MAQLIKHGALAADPWTTLALAEGETPESVTLPAGDVIFPVAVWLARKNEIVSCHKRIGLLLQPDDKVEEIAADLDYFVVVAVHFPNLSTVAATRPPRCCASAIIIRANCAPLATCCTTSYSS